MKPGGIRKSNIRHVRPNTLYVVRHGAKQASNSRILLLWAENTLAAALLGKGESGRLAVDRRLGWNAVPSNNFSSRQEGEQVILQGAGQGHSIGLCQRGAKAMAEEGSSFRQILNHYFPNTALTLFGEHGASALNGAPLP